MPDITIDIALGYGQAALKSASVPGFQLDSRLLLEYATGFSREEITGHPELLVSDVAWQQFQQLITRRIAREPVSHLMERREFWGLSYTVTRDTLDPRPDSETLIDAALKYFPDRSAPLRILDFGTGSGCLLLTLLTEYKYANGLGIDISQAALEIAKRNCLALELDNRAKLLLNNWGDGLEGPFDLIISNPPYIVEEMIDTLEPEVSRYEPHLALSGGVDGLNCYRELAPHISKLLRDGGIAILEFGRDQENDVAEIMKEHHLTVLSYARDLAGIIRALIVTINH